jgi:hypothetical protein
VVGRLLTLLRGFFSTARAGELVGFSARGFVVGSTRLLARWIAEAVGRVGAKVWGLVRFLTLCRALCSTACASEFVVLSARGFVVGSTHPLAR